MIDQERRIGVANRVLQSFALTARLEVSRGSIYVSWDGSREFIRRRWQTRGQNFYPTWSQQWIGGGTSCTALSQLVRWVQDKPVLPIASWRYWASDTIKLLPMAAVDDLFAGKYPEHVPCVLCDEIIAGGLDWWNLDGVSGPCCGWLSGCRQKGKR